MLYTSRLIRFGSATTHSQKRSKLKVVEEKKKGKF
jgi:hypothetical protein